MVFNERSLYKDQGVPDRVEEADKEKEQVELEEIIEEDIVEGARVPEPEPVTPQLRRSARTPKLRVRYSPSLHYLPLIDGWEAECFYEAMESKDSVKWVLAMKDEM